MNRLQQRIGRARQAAAVCAVLALLLTGCGQEDSPGEGQAAAEPGSSQSQASESKEESLATSEEEAVSVTEETCDWESPRLSTPADVPEGQSGELSEVLVGSWQHTHTDDGSGFEEVMNDHRYVFSSPERMLYCQHVPGATEHDENAADVVLNGTAIELPGGKYAYTVTAWDADTLVWDNPVGGGYVYLLERR